MKAVGYIRVSTDKVEQEGSLDNQKTLFIQYVKERGFEFSGFYVDVESGTKFHREGLNQMLSDANDKKFDIIITKELSRLARNAELAYQIKRIAESKNIHIITLDGQVDTTDMTRQNMFGLYAWIYEQESARISSRIKSVFKSKMKEGKFLGSNPPYGYRVTEEQSLVLRDDITLIIVKEIFDLFLKDCGFDKIAKHLTIKGIPTPATIAGKSNAGTIWHGSTIKMILTNPAYKGDMIQAREEVHSVTNKSRKAIPIDQQIIVENTHEAIIDKETFSFVQNLIQKRKKKGRGKHKQVVYLLTNYVYCKDCGGTLKYVKNRKAYICGKHYRYGNHICTSHKISEDDIVSRIRNDLSKLADSLDNEIIVKSLNNMKKSKNVLESEFKRIGKAISDNSSKKEKLLDFLLADTIDESMYHMKMEKLTLEKNDLDLKLGNLSTESNDNSIFSYEKLIKEITLIKSFEVINRNVIQKFIDKIIVSENGSLEVQYNFEI